MPLPYNERITEALAYAARLAPASQSAGTVNLGPVQLAQAKKALFILNLGAFGSSATVDAKVQTSATSGGTYADVAGGAITQQTATGLVLIEVRAETLQNLDHNPWVRVSITIATAAVVMSGEVLLAPTDYSPSSLLNTTVLQTLVV